ncbi:alpha/beta fold hydrolase [Rhodobacteraceae bacterium NNCM2]|nr:alpha/beta fold hydrolase [Coraliihabitans acroporae]
MAEHRLTTPVPGETVVALHASASSGRQWAALERDLPSGYRTLLPDLSRYGDGATPHRDTPGLARRARPVIRVIEACGAPVHLVGHSFGGAVALKVAALRPDLVRSLAVFEPAMFSLVRDSTDARDRKAFRNLKNVEARLIAALMLDDPCAGMSTFVDFWNGEGTWAAMDPFQKNTSADRASSVMRDFADGMGEKTERGDLAALQVPALVMTGTRSPAVARRTARQLVNLLPNSRIEVLEAADHMAPMVQADWVNRLIARHLRTHSSMPSRARDAA